MKSKILIVEDEPAMVAGLRDNFEYEGYEVISAEDGVSGLERALADSPDLVVLDVMMPRMSGLEVCKQVKARRPSVPIIMLTARGQEIDKVVGLELGADDYVTKPFGVLELLARVEALLRRARPPEAGEREVFRFGEIEVDTATRSVTKGGREVALTPKEYDLLVALIRRKGAVASRVELMRQVWGYSAAVLSRTVDTHVAELRRKLENGSAEPKHILTVRTIGYRLQT